MATVVLTDYGAVSGADCTAAFAAATVAASGGTLIVPAGTWINTSRHTLDPDTVVDGVGATSIIQGPAFALKTGCTISDIAFVATAGTDDCLTVFTTTAQTGITIDSCSFSGFDQAITLGASADNSGPTATITDCVFTTNTYAIYAERAFDCDIAGNTSVNANGTGRHIIFAGGARNMVTDNTLKGGIVGIGFVYNRAVSGYAGVVTGNTISGNQISGFTEEGISFDTNGTAAAAVAAFDRDTVSATGTSGPSFTIDLADPSWSSAGSKHFGYYLTFKTGTLKGRLFKIGAHSNARFTFSSSVMTSGEHASISAGDQVVICAPFLNNTVSSNATDGSSSTTRSIYLYGCCFNNTVSGNLVRGAGIRVRAITGLIKSTLNTTNTLGHAPTGYNALSGNVLLGSAGIDLDCYEFSGGGTFTSYGNTVATTFIGGSGIVSIADHDTVATGTVTLPPGARGAADKVNDRAKSR